MLIVTFTNAAAAEMKEKIRNALSGAVSSADDPAELRFLKKQADLIASANISTFHAFALEVIRRFFYIIKIEPDFRICDSTQETLLKETRWTNFWNSFLRRVIPVLPFSEMLQRRQKRKQIQRDRQKRVQHHHESARTFPVA